MQTKHREPAAGASYFEPLFWFALVLIALSVLLSSAQ